MTLQDTQFKRVQELFSSNIASIRTRLTVRDAEIPPGVARDFTDHFPVLEAHLEKLRNFQLKGEDASTAGSRRTYVEDSLDLLEAASDQISAFDFALKKSKWGKDYLRRIQSSSNT
jgi:hypothetical protein